MTGMIVTFYSYKGGVGRTFALANTAAVLSRWGYRTLCIDWDLDAPGLGFYLRPWQSEPPTAGLVDLIADYANGKDPDLGDYVIPIELPGSQAPVNFLPAGSGGDRYVRRIQELDWAGLYERHDLGEFLERCRSRWKAAYDVVLIDSRTGITDIGGICTAQLPDVLIMLFTANEQSLRGTLDIANRAVEAHDALPYDRAGLMIMPVPSRFDAREEYQRAESWQQRFATELHPLVSTWASREVPIERLLGHLTIPYVSYWSFGEDLPAIVETEPGPEKISYSLESLAAVIAHRLDRTALFAESRDSYVAAAARAGRQSRAGGQYDVYLSFGPRERELAERIAAELTGRSLQVLLPSRDLGVGDESSPAAMEMMINSRNLVVIVGESFGRGQQREVERFLRQTLDEGSERLVIPVLAPGTTVTRDLPTILAQFKAERLRNDSDEAITTLAHRIVRDTSAARAPATSAPVSSPIIDDILGTLSDLAGWLLDDMRWALVDECLDAVEQALELNDDNALQAATADLELLGPSRVSSRVSRTGSRKAIDIPPPLRDRVTALIEKLEARLLRSAGKLTRLQALTASELRVARLAARGATNREIAQTLFLSTRTVEIHLTNTYRKLNIRSRHELQSALTEH